MQPAASVFSVHASSGHGLSKASHRSITLIEAWGVSGDAHAGTTVQHRSRVRRDPTQPNLRQLHLIHHELLVELAGQGFPLLPGAMGENIMTQGLDLLSLARGTRLVLGEDAIVELTGLRNPCSQLDGLQSGLMAATLDRDAAGRLVRKAGVMAVVLGGGEVRPGDVIHVQPPTGQSEPLEPV